MFNGADWLIVTVLSISGLVSLLRGFVREAISLLAWVLAFAIAISMSGKLAILLEGQIAVLELRMIVAFLILFVSVLFVAGMVNRLLAALLKISGLSGIDRVLGMGFGVLRGVIVVLAVLVIVPPLVAVDESQWWRESTLIPHFMMLEDWAFERLGGFAEWRQSIAEKVM